MITQTVLWTVSQARSATKALLKEATDPARRAVLDSRQKALKVSGLCLIIGCRALVSPLISLHAGGAFASGRQLPE